MMFRYSEDVCCIVGIYLDPKKYDEMMLADFLYPNDPEKLKYDAVEDWASDVLDGEFKIMTPMKLRGKLFIGVNLKKCPNLSKLQERLTRMFQALSLPENTQSVQFLIGEEYI
jgi:hypothetical protein